MNYRRGFQRTYAVLAVAWIALVIFMVTSDRWIWTQWRITPTTWDALAKECGSVDVPPGELGSNPTDPSAIADQYIRQLDQQNRPAQNNNQSVKNGAKTLVVPPGPKVEWTAALSLPVPVLGYLFLFVVIPWIYRGFKSGTQI